MLPYSGARIATALLVVSFMTALLLLGAKLVGMMVVPWLIVLFIAYPQIHRSLFDGEATTLPDPVRQALPPRATELIEGTRTRASSPVPPAAAETEGGQK